MLDRLDVHTAIQYGPAAAHNQGNVRSDRRWESRTDLVFSELPIVISFTRAYASEDWESGVGAGLVAQPGVRSRRSP